MSVKMAVVYQAWFWLGLFTSGVAVVIASYFWRAAYAEQPTLSGLDLPTALRYAVLAQVVAGAGGSLGLRRMASALREGRIAHELLRPLDFQATQYAWAAGFWVVSLASRAPLLLLVAWLGVELPADPLRWLAFLASFVVGASAMFCFEWILSGLAFYTTDVWGITIAVEALALFFGGILVPLDLMPGWLRAVAEALPFQQIVYLPVSLLSGVKPLAEAPGVVAGQLAWALGLLAVSRLVFARAVRVVTVQGG
jgi:ABC-2 type transport system permease protein